MRPPIIAGIFVGGASRRMGGVPKGLMPAPEGGTLLSRWLRVLASCDASLVPVLVGSRPEYAALGLEVVPDAPGVVGPVAGLTGLLDRAAGAALAFACDMPYVDSRLVRKLLDAPAAIAVAPRTPDGRWQPFFSRFDAPRARAVVHARTAVEPAPSMQSVLDALGAAELALEPIEASALTDWDTPDDVTASPR